MGSYNSSHTGAELDAAVVDLTALLSSGGLGKNLILQNDKRLQGLNTGAANRDLIYVDTNDLIHIGEGTTAVVHGRLIVSESGTIVTTPGPFADNLVIETAGSGGASFISSNTASVRLDFGDVDSSAQGGITYLNSTDEMRIRANGADQIVAQASGRVTIPNGILVAGKGLALSGSSATIAAGVITATTSLVAVDTEGAIASDEVDTINGLQGGTILVLSSANSARDIVFMDGTGNLSLAGGDFTLTSVSDRLVLMSTGSGFTELSRSNNG